MGIKQDRWIRENKELLSGAFWGRNDGTWTFDKPDPDINVDCACCGLDYPPKSEALILDSGGGDVTDVCLLCSVSVLEFWQKLADQVVTGLKKTQTEVQKKMLKNKTVWVSRSIQS